MDPSEPTTAAAAISGADTAWLIVACAMVLLMTPALAFFYGERPWFRWVGLGFLPIVAAICWSTWSGLPTVFVFAAVSLIMIGRLQRDTLRMRIVLLAAAPFGMGYDILVGATPALIGGIVSAIIATAMLIREIKSRRQAV